MEEFTLKLREMLAGQAGVFLGHEELVKEPRLPHVVVVPVEETLGPPTDSRTQRGVASQVVDFNCRASTYQDARALAVGIWQMLQAAADPEMRLQQSARLRFGTDTWGSGRVARVAQLTGTITLPLGRSDITLARIEFIGQHVRYEALTFQEVQDDPQENSGTGVVRSDFHEHDDPPHRFGPVE